MSGTETAKQPNHSTTKRKVGHVLLSLSDIRPSPENDQLYRPVDPNDPEIVALATSIRAHGLMEPIVVTVDGFILSGHRRYAASRLAGLPTIPCRVVQIRRSDDINKFVVLLREYNRQREKTNAERIREIVVNIDPEEAFQMLVEHRKYAATINKMAAMAIDGHKHRRRITAAKQPFIEAIKRVLDERGEFWPLSDRQIHYALLNAPPLIHASK
jgi:ParB-like chromosome segregation protein Spo0J